VGVRDFADDRQAQTRPIGPASDEGLKQTLANVLRNPGSSVAHTEGDPTIAIVCFHFDGSSRWRVLDSVEDQIIKRAMHLFGVET
jgi:hypothetical protein